MVILKAIGAFFARIWRWIKETAWVQPLLIVGTIFAVIFSIPYITNWVESFSPSSANAFYTAYQQTLEGETLNGYDEKDSDTAADKLTADIYENTLATLGNHQASINSSYGEKFFLLFVNSSNSSSTGNESAFRYLNDYWKNYLIPSDSRDFKYYTIFEDDDSGNDGDYEDTLPEAFHRYLYNNMDFFTSGDIMDHLMDAPYYSRTGANDSNYEAFALASGADSFTEFPVPSILLIDYSPEAISAGRAGLSEIVFSLSGEDSAKAKTLLNMWNHLDPHSDENLFTEEA